MIPTYPNRILYVHILQLILVVSHHPVTIQCPGPLRPRRGPSHFINGATEPFMVKRGNVRKFVRCMTRQRAWYGAFAKTHLFWGLTYDIYGIFYQHMCLSSSTCCFYIGFLLAPWHAQWHPHASRQGNGIGKLETGSQNNIAVLYMDLVQRPSLVLYRCFACFISHVYIYI